MTGNGRRVLVTGGSRGIGRAIVTRLRADGADVVFTYRADSAAADATAAATGAESVRADVGDLDAMAALIDRLGAEPGGLHGFVHNAGSARPAPIADVDPEQFDAEMAANLRGPFFALRRAAATVRDGGRIVVLSSLNTALPGPGVALYAAAKAALEQVCAVAARELGPRGITVNTVSPGATDTDMLRGGNPPEALRQLTEWTALGRLGRPDDIADVVAFLLGPDARWITGQNLRVTGGLLI